MRDGWMGVASWVARRRLYSTRLGERPILGGGVVGHELDEGLLVRPESPRFPRSVKRVRLRLRLCAVGGGVDVALTLEHDEREGFHIAGELRNEAVHEGCVVPARRSKWKSGES